jgi:hypothetical protein
MVLGQSCVHVAISADFDLCHKFLHDCANAIWSLKGLESSHLSTLVTYLYQIFLITLQRMQASFILSWVIAVGLVISLATSFQLPPFQNTPNLLQAINF